MSFPPRLPSIKHVVINTLAANQIARRKGVGSSVIPNVMDFDHPPEPPDEYSASLRADLGIAPDEYFFLQPTRVVRRKGIEHAIELVKRVGGSAPGDLPRIRVTKVTNTRNTFAALRSCLV